MKILQNWAMHRYNSQYSYNAYFSLIILPFVERKPTRSMINKKQYFLIKSNLLNATCIRITNTNEQGVVILNLQRHISLFSKLSENHWIFGEIDYVFLNSIYVTTYDTTYLCLSGSSLSNHVLAHVNIAMLKSLQILMKVLKPLEMYLEGWAWQNLLFPEVIYEILEVAIIQSVIYNL